MEPSNGPGIVTVGDPCGDTVDWAAVEAVAERCGPRTQGLAAVRNAEGLRAWAAYAVQTSERWKPEVAALYDELARLVGVGRKELSRAA